MVSSFMIIFRVSIEGGDVEMQPNTSAINGTRQEEDKWPPESSDKFVRSIPSAG